MFPPIEILMKAGCSIILLFLLSSTNGYASKLNTRISSNNTIKNLKPTVFTCPLLDDDNLNIVPSTCNGSDGQITGMSGTGTGTLRFTWKNESGSIVGNNADLRGVPPGLYTVEFADDSKCKAVISQAYRVGIKNEVTFNDQNTKISKPTCNNADGSITGINITNAVQYKWIDSNRQTVATTANLSNVIADTYTLVATNAEGCSSKNTYTLPSATSVPKILHTEVIDAGCNSTGSVNVTFDISATDPPYHYALQWDGSNNDLQTGYILYRPDTATEIRLTGLAPSLVYNLYSLDGINCRTKLASYTVKPSPGYSIGIENAIIHPDVCGQHVGFILGLSINGGKKPDPKKQPKEGYFWKDSKGNPIPQGTLYLESVGAGTYTLTVKNDSGCVATRSFVIKDSTSVAVPPQVDNIALCLPQNIIITVKNPGAGTGFRLYNADSTLLRESKYPQFAEKVTKTSVFYVTTLYHTCESAKTKLTVSVALSGLIIPNTFTPNNDGINDNWNIAGIEQFPGTEIWLYNRYGQLVYHTANYSQPFNGIYGGKMLPAGVYYYILDPKKAVCQSKVSGSLTLIR